MESNGKVAVAGVNLEDVTSKDRLIISPHPVAIPIALILNQIETLSRVEICTATVVQPASEFEQIGVEELAQQTISVLNVHTVPKEVFGGRGAQVRVRDPLNKSSARVSSVSKW